jgi:hypothetical protein
MKKLFAFLLACTFGLSLAACATPPRKPPPDYEKVHQNHEKAQEDLADEEDQRQED